MHNKIIYLCCFHYSFCPHLFFLSLSFFCFLCLRFSFLFHLFFSLYLTLIIGIFYCLNYTLLLLHLISTHLVSYLSLSSIIFIISTLTHLVNMFYNNYVINMFQEIIIIHVSITNFLLISWREKDHSMNGSNEIPTHNPQPRRSV